MRLVDREARVTGQCSSTTMTGASRRLRDDSETSETSTPVAPVDACASPPGRHFSCTFSDALKRHPTYKLFWSEPEIVRNSRDKRLEVIIIDKSIDKSIDNSIDNTCS